MLLAGIPAVLDESLCLFLSSGLAVVFWLHFVVCVIDEITTHLQIRCFKVRLIRILQATSPCLCLLCPAAHVLRRAVVAVAVDLRSRSRSRSRWRAIRKTRPSDRDRSAMGFITIADCFNVHGLFSFTKPQ